ncbi:MAG TPA: DUF3499 family protein [Acidimicrobiales bacterium]|nr:DUF3499 family protein [Acidimicrobiales bacterium]
MNFASCARPGCANAAAAWLAYDYGAQCAWLDDQLDDATGRVGRWPLCERHADNLRVPRGWFCVDRRGAHFTTDPGGPDSSEGRSGTSGGGPVGDAAIGGEVEGPEQPARSRRTSASRLTAIL